MTSSKLSAGWQMTIVGILKERSSNSSDQYNFDGKLYLLMNNIQNDVSESIKRILVTLKEFDLHDASHCEKVVKNIEELIGEEGLKELSSYELFFIQLSTYLHDSAMAPAEYELKLSQLTEGTEKFHHENSVLKHDLKAPLKLSEAIAFIKENAGKLYCDFDEVSKWIFAPDNEVLLIEDLGEQLVEYQNFRNEYKLEISSLKTIAEFNELNEDIRINFIRYNHSRRIEKYVKNLVRMFEGVDIQTAFAKKMTRDLGKICRSHGEDITYVEDLDTNAQYYGDESANLQFVAVMLRLGDIMHFSFDRAPVALRSSKVFRSAYSFQEWAIKSNGVNYSIKEGLISFKAYCSSPDSYFKLHEYIDWIDGEIQNYFRCERKWDKKYIGNLEEYVDRKGVENDEDIFLPVRDLKFRIDQKQILELLMGVGLYKDKYACLRELYQNSLDACRSLKASLSNDGLSADLSITFGLEKQGEDVYLYCHDNGIGMTKDVIEKYLLNIGNSYYKSSSFYKKQAAWDGDFTPTSQFGIGILSSFMIGSQIDILTKSSNHETISCAINGPHEGFYYKTVTTLDKEKLGNSGTLIKILLLEQVKSELIDYQIEKIGLPLLSSSPHLSEKFSFYQKYFDGWEKHIYTKLDNFVCIPFSDIKIQILLDEGKQQLTIKGPRIFNHADNDLQDSDLEVVDYLPSEWAMKKNEFNYSDIHLLVISYNIQVEHNGIEFHSSLSLPKKDFPYDDISALSVIRSIKNKGYCIDGISVEGNPPFERNEGLSALLLNCGVINFTGSLRPQISVDRKTVTSWPENLSLELENLAQEFIKTVLATIKDHISKCDLTPDSHEVNLIWRYLFNKYSYGNTFFIDEIATSKFGEVTWKELEKITSRNISLNQFIHEESVTLKHLDFQVLNGVTKYIISSKLLGAKAISVKDTAIDITAGVFYKTSHISQLNDHRHNELFIASDNWSGTYSEYDIVSGVLPVIPPRLHTLLSKGDGFEAQKVNDRGLVLHAYSNGIAAFFDQDALLVHHELGIFSHDRSMFGDESTRNSVYNFQNRRTNFHLGELNSYEDYSENKILEVLYVYVSAREMSQNESQKLESYKIKDPEYYKGVNEGWSLLLTGRKTSNMVIKAGIQDRQTLVSMLPKEFWEENKGIAFKFIDGKLMEK